MKILTFLFVLGFASVQAQQCTAITLQGVQCSRMLKDTTQVLCWQHINPPKSQVKPAATQCAGLTKTGARCRNRSASQFCHLHKK